MDRNIETELHRTLPDYVVYVPGSTDGSTHDTGNEHFLVFDGPDGSLMAVWTQSTFEGMPNQRIVFARSDDEGATWSSPRVIAGQVPPAVGPMASWAFPMVSRSGRIYVVYSRHIGVNDFASHTTGLMAAICSDDAGQTWSTEQIIPMPRSIYDHTDTSVPSNWIVWQKPGRVSRGKYLAGFTRWVSLAVRNQPPSDSWTAAESVVEFMRFENLDDDPDPGDLAVTWIAHNEDAIRVPHPDDERVSIVQEPGIVELPDSSLFCAMRTRAGNPYWSVSRDAGDTWSPPAPLRFHDGGDVIQHPLSPCPVYDLQDGSILLLVHCHDGHFGTHGPDDTSFHRRPVYALRGVHDPGGDQPVRFGEPTLLMDNDGVSIGHGNGRADLSMYASVTVRDNVRVLWYPERKFFLLGRRIPNLPLPAPGVAS